MRSVFHPDLLGDEQFTPFADPARVIFAFPYQLGLGGRLGAVLEQYSTAPFHTQSRGAETEETHANLAALNAYLCDYNGGSETWLVDAQEDVAAVLAAASNFALVGITRSLVQNLDDVGANHSAFRRGYETREFKVGFGSDGDTFVERWLLPLLKV